MLITSWSEVNMSHRYRAYDMLFIYGMPHQIVRPRRYAAW